MRVSMHKLLLRLDDACPNNNKKNWLRMESILDYYNIKPLIAIIPDCKDPEINSYPYDKDFWEETIYRWKQKGWVFALHGLNHLFCSNNKGINPIHNRSEFAGLPYDIQDAKIKEGIMILQRHDITPKVFVAPAHTYDRNTIKVLLNSTSIRIISDTPASKPYNRWGITFVPQQAGQVRLLPFSTVTYCYHPNNMKSVDFEYLEKFLKKHIFSDFPIMEKTDTKLSIIDFVLMTGYYFVHQIKRY